MGHAEKTERLQNPRLADGLLLRGGSLHHMFEDLMLEAKRYGSEDLEDKTKIFWNGIGRATSAASLEIGGPNFEILRKEASTMYAGRLLSLRTYTELKKRLAKAWANFC